MRASVGLGLLGGAVDLAVGAILLLQTPMTMMPSLATALGFFAGIGLLALGVIVLVTALLMSRRGAMERGLRAGGLMLLYGALMLAIGGAMLGQVFPLMGGSLYSGITMIVLGVAMLVSGGSMARGRNRMGT